MNANALFSVCPGCDIRVGLFPLLSRVPAEALSAWKAEQLRLGFALKEHRLGPENRFQAGLGRCQCPTLTVRGTEAIARYRNALHGRPGTPEDGQLALVLTAGSRRWFEATARGGCWFVGKEAETEEVLSWLPLHKPTSLDESPAA